MKARHIYYSLAALVSSGVPLLAITLYGPSEATSVGGHLRHVGWWFFLLSAWLFATAYQISRLGSTRAVRIAGLVAMPLATLSNWYLAATLIRGWPGWAFSAATFLSYPLLAAGFCWLALGGAGTAYQAETLAQEEGEA